MISCQNFRTMLAPGTDDPSLLRHLRTCEACLDYAIGIDADLLFRSLGGEELVPPGGVDAFAADVMQQVRVRQAEGQVVAHHGAPGWPRRLAIAAVVAAGFSTSTLVYLNRQPTVSNPLSAIAVRPAAQVSFENAKLTTKPVVESYSSDNATIVEMAAEGPNDAKVVMIFDEKLPADL
ncbi:MAG TPA: hypothetical protein VEZ11_01790 [Thermoanaerobaculia bacterium]|nr:hypothetical protein [Thermoanaerobaculia bacterium]